MSASARRVQASSLTDIVKADRMASVPAAKSGAVRRRQAPSGTARIVPLRLRQK